MRKLLLTVGIAAAAAAALGSGLPAAAQADPPTDACAHGTMMAHSKIPHNDRAPGTARAHMAVPHC